MAYKPSMQKLKDANRCLQCGAHLGASYDGGLYCPECKVKRASRWKERREGLKKAGLCATCGKHRAVESRYDCAGCMAKRSGYQRDVRSKNVSNALCVTCGRSPHLLHNKFCEICYFKVAAKNNLGFVRRWKELRDKLIAQDYKCAYTGDTLVLGLNASVDHKLPRSRFPQMKGDINNAHWVRYDINYMKKDLTHEEFVELLNRIVTYQKAQGSRALPSFLTASASPHAATLNT